MSTNPEPLKIPEPPVAEFKMNLNRLRLSSASAHENIQLLGKLAPGKWPSVNFCTVGFKQPFHKKKLILFSFIFIANETAIRAGRGGVQVDPVFSVMKAAGMYLNTNYITIEQAVLFYSYK